MHRSEFDKMLEKKKKQQQKTTTTKKKNKNKKHQHTSPTESPKLYIKGYHFESFKTADKIAI